MSELLLRLRQLTEQDRKLALHKQRDIVLIPICILIAIDEKVDLLNNAETPQQIICGLQFIPQ
jgi:hypothetical protein